MNFRKLYCSILLLFVLATGNVYADSPTSTVTTFNNNGFLHPIKIGDSYGYVNSEGLIGISPQFSAADTFEHGLAIVRKGKDRHFGLINEKGDVVFPFTADWFFFDGDYITTLVAGKNGLVDRVGKSIVSPPYENFVFQEGFAYVREKQGYIDVKGNLLIPSLPIRNGLSFSDGLAGVILDEGQDFVEIGYMDKKGSIVIRKKVDDAPWPFSEGFAIVKINGKYGYMDKTGNMVIKPTYMFTNKFQNGFAIVWDDSGKKGIIDRTGAYVIKPKYSEVEPPSEGLIAVKDESGKYGYLDLKGDWMIKPTFSEARSFHNGAAVVTKDGVDQLIDKTGTVIPVRNKNTIHVAGNLIQVNSKLLDLDVTPQNDNGTMLVPLRPVFEALHIELNWDYTTRTITGTKGNTTIKLQIGNLHPTVNGKTYNLDSAPTIVEGNTLVPLRFVSESVGAEVSYTPYIIDNAVTFTKEDLLVKGAYNDAMYSYTVAEKEYENAQIAAKKAYGSYPSFFIAGKIQSRDPFIVLGQAISDNAPLNSPGWVPDNSFIEVENPDESKIQFGGYIMGEHYYKGRKRVGYLEVPVFGTPPQNVAARINQANSDLNNAASAFNNAKTSLADARQQLIAYVRSQYGKQSKDDTASDYIYKATKILAFADYLMDSFLVDLSVTQAQVAAQLDKTYDGADKLIKSGSSGIDWNGKIKHYTDVGNRNPLILLNYTRTAYQLYDAGYALSQLDGKQEYAIYALKMAYRIGNTDIKRSSSDLLKSKFNITVN